MAKNRNYVRLGEKGRTFHDPSTGLCVIRNRAVRVTTKQANSRFFRSRLRGGHIEWVPDDEVKNYVVIEPKKYPIKEEEKTPPTLKDIPNRKPDLVDFIKEFDEVTLSKEALEEENVATLKQIAKDLVEGNYEEEEDEDEDEEDEDEDEE